jgi:hypothetical protein
MEIKDQVAINRSSIRVVFDFDPDLDYPEATKKPPAVEIESSTDFFTYGELINELCIVDKLLRIPFSKNLPTKKYRCHLENTVFRGMKEVPNTDGLYIVRWKS